MPRGSPGVVGETPTLGPGQAFEYASGTTLDQRARMLTKALVTTPPGRAARSRANPNPNPNPTPNSSPSPNPPGRAARSREGSRWSRTWRRRYTHIANPAPDPNHDPDPNPNPDLGPDPDPNPGPTQDTPDTPDGSGLPFDAAVGRFECIVADGGRGDAGGDTG